MTDIPTITQEEAVEVIQADREAAAALVRWQREATEAWESADGEARQFFVLGFSRAIIQGIWDEHPLVQAFARHRIAALSPNMVHAVGGVREAARAFLINHTALYEGVIMGCRSPSLEEWRAFAAILSAAWSTPPVNQDAVREAAAEIVNEAARTWTWEAGEDEGHAYRNKACAERRAQWDDDDCPHDGSCVECADEMHKHFETPASKERRRELRNLAAKILALPGHAIVQECPGEYYPCEHSSEIVNELGNTIRFRLFAQAGQTRDGDDGGVPKVVVHAFGPTSKAIHAWTANEARELHRLLSLAFPSLALATPPLDNTGLDAVRDELTGLPLSEALANERREHDATQRAWVKRDTALREAEGKLAALATPPLDNTGLDADVAELVLRIGEAEWGATDPLSAEEHAAHVANSVRVTASASGQEGPQAMHGLYVKGTETVICHAGTSPNSPDIARALAGAWNHLRTLAFASGERS